MKFKFLQTTLVVLSVFTMSFFISCNQNGDTDTSKANGDSIVATYVANLQPLNTNVTNMNTTAQARFVMTKDSLLVTISVREAPPSMEHWQHFHGFKDNKAADCASASDDKNGDGIIDVVETETASGTTMVPFNDNPEKMDVAADSYPKAGDDSTYHYEARIPLSKLKAAFAKQFGDSTLDLDKRVLYIHGVPDNTNLPASVASIGDIPSHVTIPIACGKIEKLQE